MMKSLKRLFTPDPVQHHAHEAYVRLVVQARRPVFYAQWQAEDTIDGRFDVILLHLYLTIARLKEGDTNAQYFARVLSEVFFSDMDRSLREMGASDTGIGKRIRNMAQAFYGRLNSYGEAASDAAFRDALRRNLYREQPVEEASLSALAEYVQRNRAHLRTQPFEALLRGEITFLD